MELRLVVPVVAVVAVLGTTAAFASMQIAPPGITPASDIIGPPAQPQAEPADTPAPTTPSGQPSARPEPTPTSPSAAPDPTRLLDAGPFTPPPSAAPTPAASLSMPAPSPTTPAPSASTPPPTSEAGRALGVTHHGRGHAYAYGKGRGPAHGLPPHDRRPAAVDQGEDGGHRAASASAQAQALSLPDD